MMEKYIRKDGKVGVLIAPSYGAGWSTWSDDVEWYSMDKGLVEIALSEKSSGWEIKKYEKLIAYLKSQGKEQQYLGGWEDIEVEFVDPGTEFYIREYDGAESIVYASSFMSA